MEKELPKGWEIKNLLELAEVYTGRKDANYATEDGDYPFFTCAFSPLKSSDYSFQGNVLLLPGNGVNVGEVFYYSGKFEAYQRTYIVDKIKIHPRYLYYHFKQFWRIRGTSEQFGSATNYIKIGNFKSYNVEFPALPEQERIVAKLDNLFAHLETAKQGLEKIPVLLKQFRQAVLTQAVTGKLTEEWREGKELESFPFSEIEKLRQKLKSDFSIKQGKKSFTYKKSTYPKLGENTKGINDLFTLSTNWKWVNLDMVTWNVSDGPHFSPKYVSPEEGKRFISMRNLTSKGIDFNDCKYVSSEDHKEFVKRGNPEKGDILYSKGGSTGIPCLVFDDTDFSYWVHVALIKPIHKVIDSKYLKYALESQLCYKQSQEFTHGVGNQDLGLTRMIHICFPLPPFKEQTEIVRRVEALFSKADAIEAQYKKLKEQIDQLPQAILAKAFRGEV